MHANPQRGETRLMLDGISYTLHPTYKALTQIERDLSSGLLVIARRLCDETITLSELAIIIDHCMENRADAHFLREALVRNGLHNAIASVTALFALVLGGFTMASHAEYGQEGMTSGELREMMQRFPDHTLA